MTAPTGAEIPRLLNPPYPGFDATQYIPALNQGIPQAVISDPFPMATNPLIPPVAKGYGRYQGLGESNATWTNQGYKRSMNDRINVSISRQLPNQIVTELTYFMNFGSGLPSVDNLNMMDPMIGYTNKSTIDKQVENPFYQYLSPSKYPGPNRNQKTVALKTLLVKYPQYGNLFEAWRSGRRERYQAL
jgi:hypothetical protein